MRKVIFIMFVVLVASFLLTASAVAEDRDLGDDLKTAGKATINYPANLLNRSVNAVGTATKNTTGVVVDTAKATGETLTGDVEKAPEIITTPVAGSVETVRNATVDTVTAPVKAAEDTKEQL